MLRPIAFAVIAGLAAIAACGGSRSNAPRGATSLAARVITPEELIDTGASDLYQAIQRLRPQWLVVRARAGGGGGSGRGQRERVVVYLDGTRYGGVGSLRQLRIGGIEEIRYYNSSEATNRFGTGHGAGAIVVLTTKQEPQT